MEHPDVPPNYTRVKNFLMRREIGHMLSTFIIQKIDDEVAANMEYSKLESMGMVHGDIMAYREEFQGGGSTNLKSYKDRKAELIEKLRGSHNTRKISRVLRYVVSVRLKTLETESKYTLKNKAVFVKEYQSDACYQDIHWDAREHFKIPLHTETFLGGYQDATSLQTVFKSVENHYVQSRGKKKGMLLYLYYPHDYRRLVTERLHPEGPEGPEDPAYSDTASITIPNDNSNHQIGLSLNNNVTMSNSNHQLGISFDNATMSNSNHQLGISFDNATMSNSNHQLGMSFDNATMSNSNHQLEMSFDNATTINSNHQVGLSFNNATVGNSNYQVGVSMQNANMSNLGFDGRDLLFTTASHLRTSHTSQTSVSDSVVCKDCGSTYVNPATLSCLRCEQDNAYNVSLSTDSAVNSDQRIIFEEEIEIERPQRTRKKPLRYRRSINSPTPISPPVESPPPLDLMELRNRRLSALVGVSSSTISRAPVSSSLPQVPSISTSYAEVSSPTISQAQESSPSAQVSSNSIFDAEVTIPSDDGPIAITVSRMRIFQQVLDLFKNIDDNLLNRHFNWIIKSDNGIEEYGRGIGIYRDVLTTFWNEFYASYCLGEAQLLPQLRHDVFTEDWAAIAKVLIKGFEDCGYVPMQLNKVFLKNCFGDTDFTNEQLYESFLRYLSKDDSKALNDAITEEGSNDDILDILTALGSKRVCYSGQGLKDLIIEIAHKEIIQQPAFIKEIWETQIKRHYFSEVDRKKILGMTHPTNKEVIALLKMTEETDKAIDSQVKSQETFQWLKKFVRSMSHPVLRNFLRHCTGSDVICVNEINVTFNDNWSDFARRFIGRTCGAVLEVPSTYSSYIEFKAAFEKQLSSPYWGFDIV